MRHFATCVRAVMVVGLGVMGVQTAVALPPPAAKPPIAEIKQCTKLHPETCPPVATLSALKGEARPVAVALLQHEDPWIRQAGARVLLRTADKEAAPDLAARLTDPDSAVRAAVYDALGVCGTAAQGAALFARAQTETEREPRVAALRALGQLGWTAAREFLETALNDADGHVQAAGLHGLRHLAAPESVVPVATLLCDPRVLPEIQAEAVRTLVAIKTPQVVPPLIQAAVAGPLDVRRPAIVGLGAVQALGAVALLIDLLSEDAILRETVLALGALRDERVLTPLLTVLRAADLDVDIRRSVLVSLGQQRVTSAVPELLAMIREAPADIVPDILRALGQIGDERAIGRLIETLRSRDEAVVSAANSALAVITGQRFDPDPAIWNAWLVERDAPPESFRTTP